MTAINFDAANRRIMFEITQCDPATGCVLVEDKEFGLSYEFNEPELKDAAIVDDYDLHITTKNGEKKILAILNR